MIYILGFLVIAGLILYSCCIAASDADDLSERYFNERHKNHPKN